MSSQKKKLAIYYDEKGSIGELIVTAEYTIQNIFDYQSGELIKREYNESLRIALVTFLLPEKLSPFSKQHLSLGIEIENQSYISGTSFQIEFPSGYVTWGFLLDRPHRRLNQTRVEIKRIETLIATNCNYEEFDVPIPDTDLIFPWYSIEIREYPNAASILELITKIDLETYKYPGDGKLMEKNDGNLIWTFLKKFDI